MKRDPRGIRLLMKIRIQIVISLVAQEQASCISTYISFLGVATYFHDDALHAFTCRVTAESSSHLEDWLAECSN
jgi:hypothetical protein